MAIGVIIGGAFGKIVTSFVNDIVMPGVTAIIAMAGGKDAGEGLKSLSYTTAAGVEIPYGNFIGGIVDFLIVAIVVFLVMKKFLGFMQNMRKQEAEAPAAPPAPPEPSAEEKLLTEIRDLLKK
jgi:large conductance mechanosensitive channel